jgi:hypothetical protein
MSAINTRMTQAGYSACGYWHSGMPPCPSRPARPVTWNARHASVLLRVPDCDMKLRALRAVEGAGTPRYTGRCARLLQRRVLPPVAVGAAGRARCALAVAGACQRDASAGVQLW